MRREEFKCNFVVIRGYSFWFWFVFKFNSIERFFNSMIYKYRVDELVEDMLSYIQLYSIRIIFGFVVFI